MTEKLILPDLTSSDEMFLSELSTKVTELHHTHNDSPREFFPFDVADEMNEAIVSGDFVPEEEPLPEAVKSSLFVNLLTEEGLPYYTSTLERGIPKKHPFRDWVNRWTAEEGRHAPRIAIYMHLTKQFDMHTLERSRMTMMIDPDTPQPGSFIEGIVYPAFQEPATEVSHRNTMRLLPTAHKIGKKAIGSVVGDEVKHGIFYGELVKAALDLDPSSTIIAIARQVRDFAMPGKSIPDFDKHKSVIANAGIFGAPQLKNIYDEKITRQWNIWNLSGLNADAERARDYLEEYLRKMGRAIEWAAAKRTPKLI